MLTLVLQARSSEVKKIANDLRHLGRAPSFCLWLHCGCFTHPSAAIVEAPRATAAFQTTIATKGSDNVKISIRPAGGRCRADRGGAGDAGADATAATVAVRDHQGRGHR